MKAGTDLSSARIQAAHYMAIHRFEQARQLYRQLLAEAPTDPELLKAMAWCQYKLKAYPDSVETARQALAYGDADDPGLLALLGHCEMAQGNAAAAERHFLAVLRQAPTDAQTMAYYALLLLKNGQEQKAGRVLQEALRLAPEHEAVLHVRYLFQLAKGRASAQVEALEQYIIHGSDEVHKLVTLARSALYRGRMREAKEYVRQAFLLDPTNSGLLSFLRSLEQDTHPLRYPMVLINRIGGPGVVWLAAVLMMAGSALLGYTQVTLWVSVAYLALVLYTWLVPLILRLYYRRRG